MKKIISILLLFAFLHFCCFSVDPYQSSVQFNITKLEQIMIDLQNGSIERQILVQDLQKQLESANQSVDSLTNQVDEISQISETQSKLLKKQDITLRVFRTTLIVAVPMSFIIGLMIGLNTKG